MVEFLSFVVFLVGLFLSVFLLALLVHTEKAKKAAELAMTAMTKERDDALAEANRLAEQLAEQQTLVGERNARVNDLDREKNSALDRGEYLANIAESILVQLLQTSLVLWQTGDGGPAQAEASVIKAMKHLADLEAHSRCAAVGVLTLANSPTTSREFADMIGSVIERQGAAFREASFGIGDEATRYLLFIRTSPSTTLKRVVAANLR